MRITLTVELDTDEPGDEPADPTEMGKAFGDVLLDTDPFELADGGDYFVSKVTDIHIST